MPVMASFLAVSLFLILVLFTGTNTTTIILFICQVRYRRNKKAKPHGDIKAHNSNANKTQNV